jgi:hypothetical protein
MVEKKYITLDPVLHRDVACEPPSTTQVILAGLYIVICLGLIVAVLGTLILS